MPLIFSGLMGFGSTASGAFSSTAVNQKVDPFRIALLDYNMPKTDGRTLGGQIKTDQELCDIKLVMLTSLGHRGDAQELLEAGFDAYLVKPIKQSLLFDCLQMVLTRHKTKTGASKKQLITRHSISEHRRSRLRILLVEDHLVNQQVALLILKIKLGYHADAAANGKEALDALSKRDYDLVLMDCQMPEIDGYEATRIIRDPNSSVRNHDIKIIAMTANAMTDDRKKCLDAGMNDYIAKPIKSEILSETIYRCFPEQANKMQPASTATKKVDSGKLNKSDNGSPQSIQSEFADDPDMVEIIDDFVKGLPDIISSMREAAKHNHHEELQRLAHQLKGAGGGYGYPLLTKTAKNLEDAAKTRDIEKARLVLSSLNQLCNAVVAGRKIKATKKGAKL